MVPADKCAAISLFAILYVILVSSVSPSSAQFTRSDCLPGAGIRSSSIADVNNDGNADILVTGTDSSLNASAYLFLGNGKGEFSRADADFVGVDYGSSSIADMTGDGNPDVLITGSDTSNAISATLYSGNGEGAFTPANAGLTGVYWSSSSTADINNDGHMDLLITGMDSSRTLRTNLYLGNGKGDFSKAGADLVDVWGGSSAIGDVNADGNQDLLITGQNNSQKYITKLYYGDGNAGFTLANASLPGISTGDVSIADVDDNGYEDLLITGNPEDELTNPLYLSYPGDSLSHLESSLVNLNISSSTIADVDGDGHLDILINGDANANGSTEPKTLLYLGNGDGGFKRLKTDLPDIRGGSSTIADFNNDDRLDILLLGGNNDGRVSCIYENQGSGFTSIKDSEKLPSSFRLDKNYPNPFNPTTHIQYSLPKTSRVQLTVHDLLGHRVARLVNGKRPMGQHTVSFDAGNLASGVYIYQLKTEEFSKSRKMLLIK